MKKPVVYPYQDCSTLEAREARCRDEVRLKRRLAPYVYLGVARLTLLADGRLAIEGAGVTLDWRVRMRRLPEHRTLEHLIVRGELAPEHVAQIGEVLARFYRGLAPAEVDAQRYVELLRAKIEARAVGGHVVEGHGDLRPEHVFLLDAPVIIDCLQSNCALRLVDPLTRSVSSASSASASARRGSASDCAARSKRCSATASTTGCSTSTSRCTPACARASRLRT